MSNLPDNVLETRPPRGCILRKSGALRLSYMPFVRSSMVGVEPTTSGWSPVVESNYAPSVYSRVPSQMTNEGNIIYTYSVDNGVIYID